MKGTGKTKTKKSVNNGIFALRTLIKDLKISVTDEGIEKAKLHPDYPSILSLSDALFEWGINNKVIKAKIDQLSEFEYPVIAHTDKLDGSFVVIHKVDRHSMTYSDEKEGLVKSTITEFEKNWTGIVLLVEKLSDSGELAFEEKEQKEKSERFVKNCWYVILSSFLVLPFFFLNISTSLIYFLKMIGGFASFMLLRKQFGYASSFIDDFCKMGRKSDCDAVIQSKSSKLLGSINISEVGLWYFSSGIITTSVSIFLPFSSDLVLLIISVGALLLSIVAIYVQAIVIKKWCPLCLVIASVILLELILRLISQPSFFYGKEQLFIVFFCFSLPLVYWLGIRARFLSSFKLFNKDRKLMRLLRNEEIFSALLEKQRFLETVAFNSELYSGFQDSPLQIVMVSNPLCGPCSKAHSVLNNLSETLGDKINIIYRFSLPKDANSRSYEMLRVLFTIQQTNNMKLALQALTAWYAYGKKDFSKWKKDFVNGSVDSNLAVDDFILEHINWVKEVRIKKTPTIFVNGKELPEEYSISDLKYHLRRMVESNEVSLMT